MDIENNLCFSIENMKHEQRILSGQTVNICNDGRWWFFFVHQIKIIDSKSINQSINRTEKKWKIDTKRTQLKIDQQKCMGH